MFKLIYVHSVRLLYCIHRNMKEFWLTYLSNTFKFVFYLYIIPYVTKHSVHIRIKIRDAHTYLHIPNGIELSNFIHRSSNRVHTRLGQHSLNI